MKKLILSAMVMIGVTGRLWPSADTLFADAAASAGGDGSEARPFDGAHWIGEDPAPALPDRRNGIGARIARLQSPACPVFAREVELDGKPIASATARVTGLGFYDFRVNAKSPDPLRLMTPGWTCPDWCVYYDTYDVKSLLKPGKNRLEIELAGGYDDSVFNWNWRWEHAKRAILALDVRFADGTSRRIVTDESWRWTSDGPRVSASLYNGETCDATRDGAKAVWRKVKTLDDAGLKLAANPGPAVHRSDPRPPVSIRHCGGGRHILDFGVNRAGLTELRARLPRGTRVTMRHAEEVKGDKIDMQTSRSAQQCDTYVAAGTGEIESYVPRFTYHGYRYVEVTGLPDELAVPGNFTGWGVTADIREKATFESSSPALNWLWDAARRSMRSNFVTFPSDCPMRDERTPCLMDSQVYEDAAFQVYDISQFYSKWLFDTARYELVLDPKAKSNDHPDWSGEPFTLAERFLTYCAATNVALREYAELKRAAERFAAAAPDGLWTEGFGDWCTPFGFTPAALSSALVNTALLFEDYRILARLAALKGETADAARYAALRDRTRTAFLAKFYDAKAKRFGEGHAVDQILPLKFGLVPDGAAKDVAAALAERIRKDDRGHLSVGIFGNRYAGDVLLDTGYGDLWLAALEKSDWPGFGFMRANGATSLWEQWTRDGPMNSHNHAMFAGVVSAFFTHLAGIRPAADGYSRVLVKPCFPKGLDSLKASIETPVGTFSVEWHRVGDHVDYAIDVPAHASVEWQLPPEARLCAAPGSR